MQGYELENIINALGEHNLSIQINSPMQNSPMHPTKRCADLRDHMWSCIITEGHENNTVAAATADTMLEAVEQAIQKFHAKQKEALDSLDIQADRLRMLCRDVKTSAMLTQELNESKRRNELVLEAAKEWRLSTTEPLTHDSTDEEWAKQYHEQVPASCKYSLFGFIDDVKRKIAELRFDEEKRFKEEQARKAVDEIFQEESDDKSNPHKS